MEFAPELRAWRLFAATKGLTGWLSIEDEDAVYHMRFADNEDMVWVAYGALSSPGEISISLDDNPRRTWILNDQVWACEVLHPGNSPLHWNINGKTEIIPAEFWEQLTQRPVADQQH